MDERLIFLSREIARARDILQDNGINLYRLQETSGGEFELAMRSAHFERAKELLTAAGIQYHT
jgi:hypothetical protein